MHYKWHYEDLGHVTKGGGPKDVQTISSAFACME